MSENIVPFPFSLSTNVVETDEYFGGCPHCGKTNGYLNVGPHHYFVCDEHKTKWYAGSNLFSCWREETEEQHHKNKAKLLSYIEVAPVLPRDREVDADTAATPSEGSLGDCIIAEFPSADLRRLRGSDDPVS